MGEQVPNAAERLEIIRNRMRKAALRFDPEGRDVTLVAVSKTFDADAILPLISAGQRIFGENRVQEAMGKWLGLRRRYPDIELHLIGPLQTNKVPEAVALFDVIETLDRDKLALALKKEMAAKNRRLPCYIQVNIGARGPEIRHCRRRSPGFRDALSRGLRTRYRRADGHSAARRGTGALFRSFAAACRPAGP